MKTRTNAIIQKFINIFILIVWLLASLPAAGQAADLSAVGQEPTPIETPISGEETPPPGPALVEGSGTEPGEVPQENPTETLIPSPAETTTETAPAIPPGEEPAAPTPEVTATESETPLPSSTPPATETETPSETPTAVSTETASPTATAVLDNSISYTLDTPAYQITTDEKGSAQFQMADFSPAGTAGDPGLPFKMVNLALPPDVDWQSVRLDILSAENRNAGRGLRDRPGAARGHLDRR